MLKAAMFSREMARVFLVPDTGNGTPPDLQQVSHVTKPDVLDRKRLKLVELKKGTCRLRRALLNIKITHRL